ncbi:uncharacterized protein N0V89_006867 [Didymosphaeria variabile]|uniref:Uncharacterized protein n=1 Tax=Didymosphaeria variabile TaxID=1932322 RepID=A0A9W8XIE1_9PLEO|nr:uncharacterized protein N0V89_006867 [Didymosphaeria variabile]KAJ4351524.1 hypothetical protein N0V89_006867 [Didymosphaeria variabile]
MAPSRSADNSSLGSDSSSSDESLEVGETTENDNGLMMDVDEDEGAIGDYNLTVSGKLNPIAMPSTDYLQQTDAEKDNNYDGDNKNSDVDNEMTDYAPWEHSSDSQRPTKRNRAKKTNSRKAKRGIRVPDENSEHAWSTSTFKNKVGIAGMEAFLRRPEFGVDVDAEFPSTGLPDKPYRDIDGTQIGRGAAMAHKCHYLHQTLIDAKAEDDFRQASVNQLIRESRIYHPPELAARDTHQTTLARTHLQSIRHHATVQVNAAFDNNHQPTAQLSELELDSDGQPLISAAVQHLIYSVVVTQIRGNRLRNLHVSEAGDQRFQIPADYAELRARLKYELQSTLRLEEDVDREATARKLLMQEFPQQL